MRQLLRRRLRQLVRVTLVLAIGLAVAAAALAIWWLTSLNGLPDIGDPFDVEEFRAFSVPDDRNAFTYLRRASEKLTPVRGVVVGQGADPGQLKFSWSIARPMWREWAGENREAFELFRQAAEQSDAANPAGDPTTDVHPDSLIMLSLLEASRRQESGDTAGAWDCYRSVLRMITHFRRRGSTLQRDSRQEVEPFAAATAHRLGGRSEDHDPPASYRAGSRARERAGARLGSIRDQIRVSRNHERAGAADTVVCLARDRGGMDVSARRHALSPEMVEHLEAAHRFLLREPERGRRILRLVCANYLAHVETRERPPRKPAVWAMFSYLDIIDSDHEAQDRRAALPRQFAGTCRGPRAISAGGGRLAGLDHRRQAANHGGYIEWHWPADRVLDRRVVPDRRAHRELVIMLATEIYRRERGASTFRRSPGRDLSQELARRRLGRG